jgi:hypothetical protein
LAIFGRPGGDPAHFAIMGGKSKSPIIANPLLPFLVSEGEKKCFGHLEWLKK